MDHCGSPAISQNPLGLHCTYILEDPDTFKNTITSFNFCFVGEEVEPLFVASYVNGMTKFWHISSKQCISTIHENNSEALVCAISNDNRSLFTAGDRKVILGEGTEPSYTINKYDVETKKLVSTFGKTHSKFVMDGHVRRIYSLKMSPISNSTFISAGWDDTIQFWDDRVNSVRHSVRKIAGPHISSENGLDISADGSEILAASWRRLDNLQTFDFASGKLLKTYSVSQKSTCSSSYNSYSCKFLDDKTVAVGTSTSNNLILFNRNYSASKTGEIPDAFISDLPGGVYAFDETWLGNRPRYFTGREISTTRMFGIASSNNVYICNQKIKQIIEEYE